MENSDLIYIIIWLYLIIIEENIIKIQIQIPSVNWLWRTQEIGLQSVYVAPQHFSFCAEDADPLFVKVHTAIMSANAVPSAWLFHQSTSGSLFLQPVARKVSAYLSEKIAESKTEETYDKIIEK